MENDKNRIELKLHNLTKEEYRSINYKINRERYKWYIRGGFLFLGGIALLILWGISLGIQDELIETWTPIVIMVVIWMWLIIWGGPILLGNLKSNRHQYQTYRYTVEDGFLISEREDGAMEKYPLSKLVKVLIVAEHYVLYINSYSAHFIPFSLFHSADDRDKFERSVFQ